MPRTVGPVGQGRLSNQMLRSRDRAGVAAKRIAVCPGPDPITPSPPSMALRPRGARSARSPANTVCSPTVLSGKATAPAVVGTEGDAV